MGDDENRFSLDEASQRCLDVGLGLRVGECRRLVEDEDRSIDEKGTRDCDSLGLPSRGMSVLSDHCIQSVRQAAQVVVDAGGCGSLPDRLIAGAGYTERDVVAYGDIEELRVLEHKGDVTVEDFGSDVSHVNASDAHATAIRIGEACDQRRER